MSGLAGHMSYLYENSLLTIGELKEILHLISEGKLENVQEKLDGQNVFFTYNADIDSLRFARNKTHIKQGGMSSADILDKWNHAPAVAEAFHSAYQVLAKGIKTLSTEIIRKAFGSTGNIWYSGEIIHAKTSNVIEYGRNAFVLHESGTMYDNHGNVLSHSTEENFAVLKMVISKLHDVASDSDWSVSGPIVLELAKPINRLAGLTATLRLEREMSDFGLDDNSTLADYVALKFAMIAQNRLKDVSYVQALELGKVFAVPNILPGQRKKQALEILTSKEVAELFRSKEQTAYYKEIMRPIEDIIYDFAVDVLSGLNSALALFPHEEVSRLRASVKHGIRKITLSGNQDYLERMKFELARLKSLEHISSSLEGIVFKYNSHTYKMVGAFRPTNQLLGMITYSLNKATS